MGIRDVFKKKEPTEEELIEGLTQAGIATKNRNPNHGRQEKFGAFKQYAQYKSEAQPGLKPVANPYANMNNGNNNNYQGGDFNGQPSSNPYGVNGGPSNNGNNPYGSGRNSSSSPYSSSNNINSSSTNNTNSPYATTSTNSPYATSSTTNSTYSSNSTNSPYNRASAINARTSTRQPQRTSQQNVNGDGESVLDLNDIPSNRIVGSSNRTKVVKRSTRPVNNAYDDDEEEDLNAIPSQKIHGSSNKSNLARRPQGYEDDDLDLNEVPGEEDDDLYIPEEEQVNSEDEEIESIKQEIRFTKQESVQSTRNTLRMAQEADASASNTLGMLGSQSERLYNAEQNLMLIDAQTQISGEKVKELGRLNRSIFIPAYGNPFNKKARLRQQEEKIKLDKEKEHYLRDQARKGMYESEQRLKSGINEKSELYQNYKGSKALKEASKRYQFENDSEDDELEVELDSNLSQIEQYSKMIKSKAIKMGDEVDKQNLRLKQIEENVDKADIDIHVNTARISNIH